MLLGEKIKAMLDEKGWSASRLARLVKVSPAAISRIIGGGDTSTAIGVRISRSLSVPAMWLFDDSLGWEERARHESSLDLAGVSDLDLVSILETRVNRTEVLYTKLLESIKQIPSEGEGSGSAEQRQALREAIVLAGYNRQIYIGLLDCLVKLQECVGQTVDEIQRITGADMKGVIGAGERLATRLILERVRKPFEEQGVPFPPHRRECESSSDVSQPARSGSRSTPKRRSTNKKSRTAKSNKPKPPRRS